jgi:lipoprotein-anchoring transpeptidase ErfK/SrfK
MFVRRLGLAAVAVVVTVVAGGCGARTALHPQVTAKPHKAVVVEAPVEPPGTTLTATILSDVPGSPTPGAPSNLQVPSSWYGSPTILPVIDRVPGWDEVRLAQRPNGSVTWVPAADVIPGLTPFRIVVNLHTTQLTVFEDGREILDFPAGIGTPDDPTVTGSYFMTMQVPAPNAGYGPFVLVTSAHSDSITDWADSGDAIIAIHGPITSHDDALIGATGAAISHGCIRLHDADLAQLATIPAGTPIDIVAS